MNRSKNKKSYWTRGQKILALCQTNGKQSDESSTDNENDSIDVQKEEEVNIEFFDTEEDMKNVVEEIAGLLGQLPEDFVKDDAVEDGINFNLLDFQINNTSLPEKDIYVNQAQSHISSEIDKYGNEEAMLGKSSSNHGSSKPKEVLGIVDVEFVYQSESHCDALSIAAEYTNRSTTISNVSNDHLSNSNLKLSASHISSHVGKHSNEESVLDKTSSNHGSSKPKEVTDIVDLEFVYQSESHCDSSSIAEEYNRSTTISNVSNDHLSNSNLKLSASHISSHVGKHSNEESVLDKTSSNHGSSKPKEVTDIVDLEFVYQSESHCDSSSIAEEYNRSTTISNVSNDHLSNSNLKLSASHISSHVGKHSNEESVLDKTSSNHGSSKPKEVTDIVDLEFVYQSESHCDSSSIAEEYNRSTTISNVSNDHLSNSNLKLSASHISSHIGKHSNEESVLDKSSFNQGSSKPKEVTDIVDFEFVYLSEYHCDSSSIAEEYNNRSTTISNVSNDHFSNSNLKLSKFHTSSDVGQHSNQESILSKSFSNHGSSKPKKILYTVDHDYIYQYESSSDDSSMGVGDNNIKEVINNFPNNNLCDTNNKLMVNPLTEKKIDGRRYWDHKHCCIFCNPSKLVTNFERHLKRNHSHELEVGKMLASTGYERKKLLGKIRKRGNFFHNTNVLREKEGKLIVARRPAPTETDAVEDYLPCTHCLAFFKKDKLYLHTKNCVKLEKRKKFVSHQSQGALLLDIDNLTEFQDLKDLIFPIMRVDNVSQIVKSDQLICEFGSRLLKKNTEPHLRQVISGKMRELGRLLLQLHEKSNTCHPLQEFLSPKNYTMVVECVKSVSGYNSEKGTYKTPSLATKLGHSVRQCADIMECKAMIISNNIMKETASNFKSICDKQWVFDISGRAQKTLASNQYNKTNLIPLAKDIQLLHKLISEREENDRQHLIKEPSDIAWRNLARVTLAHVIVLNRRRSGEVQRMMLEDYKKLHQGIEDPETESSFNKVEKLLTKNLYRLEIRGKRGNKVPVLLTPVLKKNLDLLISMRMACNVDVCNPYLFALPSTDSSCIRGSDSLRALAKDCGASSPKSLTSTKLRKHVATVSQLINLEKNELEQVAQFMGHSLNVHFDFYRLPERDVQIAKLGKLFLALEQGKIAQYHGKKLDDITVEINENDLCSDSEEGEVDITSDKEQESNLVMPSTSQSQSSSEAQANTYETDGCHNVNVRKRKVIKSNSRQSKEDSESDWMEEEEETITTKRKFKLRKVVKKRPWSDSEITAVIKHLQKNILMEIVPSKRDCENCKNQEDVLKDRTWTQIKDFVYNRITKARRSNTKP